jgi:hypothetical protein
MFFLQEKMHKKWVYYLPLQLSFMCYNGPQCLHQLQCSQWTLVPT